MFICLFLLGISFLHHYFKHSALPSVCWILLAGVLYGWTDRQLNLDLPHAYIEPDIVLFILLPVLIFDSARKIPILELESVALETGFLATFGVAAVAFLIGLPLAAVANIPILDAIFFGTIMAATDPVAVSAIFKSFSFPEKLNVLVEGESLLNDGTGIILYTVMGTVILEGMAFSLSSSIVSFIVAIAGAITVGLIAGTIASQLMRMWKEVHDKFIGAILPIICIYFIFVIAEHFLHVSGIIAVMSATMIMTHFHDHLSHADKDSRHTDSYFNDFWTFLGDLANKILFFMLGASIGGHLYALPWKMMPFLIIILLFSRSAVVYLSGFLFKQFGRPLSVSWLNVINLAGLKGALSIALILLIPKDYVYRELFHCAAFILILFTLLGNSLAMRWYLNRTKLT